MISSITGTIKAIQGNSLIVDVGPVAFEVTVADPKMKLQEVLSLHIYMHWNQEQGPSLYGFAHELDRTVFLMIIGCSGVGPKLGMAILSHMGAATFLEAIQTSNGKALSSVSGVGAKKAEQLIVNLRDKVAKLVKTGIDIGGATQLSHWTTVSETLTSLNYSRGEIAAVMKHLSDAYHEKQLPFDQLMRHALSYLAKRTMPGI